MSLEYPQLMPREKLLKFGVEALSDAELLALFLRTGTRNLPVLELSQSLLNDFGSLYNLINASHEDFCQNHGLGTAKYTQLKAVVELSSRYLKVKMTHENSLSSPSVTHHYLASRLANKDREIFMVIFLDNQHHVISSEEMFVGTYNCVEVHPREVARRALQHNAAALILAHNHPSGMAEPSQADRHLTQKIEEVCELVDIRVIDHIVIGKGEYVSFAERGWIL
ncbi:MULTISPECIES: DNA repair protein RadC [Gilliamella]|uniref:DNA repair protein RadC n=1 Tax=Gilliamella intestini TaxID=1798183 RepID=A0A1C4B4Y2_9GAMM|nr:MULTISPECIES: DNA repair protein RadC [Gilliamella]SCC01854.1 DNA repair protein RadC [Gilliamella intestini]